ncbi:MAG: cyclase family protein [Bryobacteraceae bacterium]
MITRRALLATLPLFAQEKADKTTIDRWMKELSNWGRWGKDDQLGAVNLITAAKRKQAAALVREGVSVSLSRDTEKEKAEDNPRPFTQEMNNTGGNPAGGQFSVDTYSVLYHGYAHTHMDSLCHMFYEGKMYNGFSQDEVGAEGAKKLAINAFKNGILSRGVLLDIPSLKGVPYLEPGAPIYPEDLDAWEKRAGLKVTAGDIVFVRTGRWARRAALGPWNVGLRSAGLHASCAPWLRKRDVAMVGSDAGCDVMPSRVEGVRQPIHQLLLVAMGTPIFDNCDLEAISDASATRKRWTFMLSAAPISVKGGTGSPLNPIATF